MKNKLSDLRNHLFLTLEGLTNPDPENPIDLEKARTIAEVAQVVVNSAKIEVDFYKVTNSDPRKNDFFEIDNLKQLS